MNNPRVGECWEVDGELLVKVMGFEFIYIKCMIIYADNDILIGCDWACLDSQFIRRIREAE